MRGAETEGTTASVNLRLQISLGRIGGKISTRSSLQNYEEFNPPFSAQRGRTHHRKVFLDTFCQCSANFCLGYRRVTYRRGNCAALFHTSRNYVAALQRDVCCDVAAVGHDRGHANDVGLMRADIAAHDVDDEATDGDVRFVGRLIRLRRGDRHLWRRGVEWIAA